MKFLREIQDVLKKEKITIEVLRHKKHYILKCKNSGGKEIITTVSSSTASKFAHKRIVSDIKRGFKNNS